MSSNVLYLVRRQGRYFWTSQIAPVPTWSGVVLPDKIWACGRTRSYRAQGWYMLGRKCEHSYQLDRFWLILLTTIDRTSRDGMKYCHCWWYESTYWLFLFRQETSRDNLLSGLVLVIVNVSICMFYFSWLYALRTLLFLDPLPLHLSFMFVPCYETQKSY